MATFALSLPRNRTAILLAQVFTSPKSSVPLDLTAAGVLDIRFFAKNNYEDADTDALIIKTYLVNPPVDPGGITITDAPNGKFSIQLDAADVNNPLMGTLTALSCGIVGFFPGVGGGPEVSYDLADGTISVYSGGGRSIT